MNMKVKVREQGRQMHIFFDDMQREMDREFFNNNKKERT